MKKIVSLLLALCMLLTLTSLALADDETIVLRFSWWGGDERLAATLEVIEQFEALYPNVKIEAEYGSSDGYTDKLATQLAGGTAPDIMQIDPAVFGSFITDEIYFVDYLAEGFDFSQFDESYISQQVNGRFDGKQYGIPTGIAGGAMLVNEKLAQEIGIDFHTQYTWEDMFTWAKMVREYDSSMYLLCANTTTVKNLVVAYAKQLTGKTTFDQETKTLNYTKEEWTEILTFAKRLYDEGVVPPASYSAAYAGDNLQSDPNWIAGKYVSCFCYTSTCEIIAAAAPDVEFTCGLFPVMEGAKTDAHNANCPQVIAVNSKSEHKDMALAFVDYFFNNETAQATLGTVRSVPPTENARRLAEENGKLSNMLKSAADICAMYNGMPDDKYATSGECVQIQLDAIEALGYGVVTAGAEAEEIMSLLEAMVANY